MNTTNIGDFVEKKFLKFDKECSIEEALKGFKKFDCTEGYFVDNQNQFLGKLKLIDILGKKSEMSLKYKEKSFLKLKPDSNINETINILGSFVGESVPVIDNKNVVEVKYVEDENMHGCSIIHNGYEKDFSCIHKREIYLDHETNKLKGIDHIFKKSDGLPIRYVFRFHLNPELEAVKTMSGNSALIQVTKNKSLVFTVKDEVLEMEKSIYLGGKKILDNTCITISGNLVNKSKSFYWEIKKKI